MTGREIEGAVVINMMMISLFISNESFLTFLSVLFGRWVGVCVSIIILELAVYYSHISNLLKRVSSSLEVDEVLLV